MAADDSEAVDDSDAISLGPMQKRRRTVNYGDSNAWMLQQDEESDMQQDDQDSDSIDTIDYGGSLDWMQQQDSTMLEFLGRPLHVNFCHSVILYLSLFRSSVLLIALLCVRMPLLARYRGLLKSALASYRWV